MVAALAYSIYPPSLAPLGHRCSGPPCPFLRSGLSLLIFILCCLFDGLMQCDYAEGPACKGWIVVLKVICLVFH